MHRYKNPWYDPKKPRHNGQYKNGKQGAYNLKFYECETPPERYRGYEIFHRVNHVEKDANVFDIVLNGECVSQCAGINGAKRAIDSLVLEGCTLHKCANGTGGYSYTWADDKTGNALGFEPTAQEIAEHERKGAF